MATRKGSYAQVPGAGRSLFSVDVGSVCFGLDGLCVSTASVAIGGLDLSDFSPGKTWSEGKTVGWLVHSVCWDSDAPCSCSKGTLKAMIPEAGPNV